jgi:hypothetical protein
MGTPREINAMGEEVPGDGRDPLNGTLSAPPASLLAIGTVAAAGETVGTAGGVSETVVDGVAGSVAAGVPDGWTVSMADDEADPAAPLQVRV